MSAGALAGAAGGLVGGLASAAMPYGAMAQAAGQVMTAALTDPPTNVTSGAGSYAAGPFTVGAKIVGQGNDAGATTASQSADQNPGAALKGMPSWTIPAIGAGVLLVALVYLLKKK